MIGTVKVGLAVRLDLEIGGDGLGAGEAVVGEFDGQLVIERFAGVEGEVEDGRA